MELADSVELVDFQVEIGDKVYEKTTSYRIYEKKHVHIMGILIKLLCLVMFCLLLIILHTELASNKPTTDITIYQTSVSTYAKSKLLKLVEFLMSRLQVIYSKLAQ